MLFEQRRPWLDAVHNHKWHITTMPCNECGITAKGITAASLTFCITCLDDQRLWFPIGRMAPYPATMLQHALECVGHQ